MKRLIAVVDDEPDILDLISIHIKKAGLNVVTFEKAQKLLDYVENNSADLIILDIMLPDMDGIEVCKQLRSEKRFAHIPILFLSAKDEEFDKILGLEIGADDYVTKPFSPRELIARIKAILRRKGQPSDNQYIDLDNILKIDLQKYTVHVNQKKVDLTTTEFKILRILAEKRGWVFSREQLLEKLWGNDKIVLDRTIDVHIKNLRDKLGIAGKVIKNIRGVGYKIEE